MSLGELSGGHISRRPVVSGGWAGPAARRRRSHPGFWREPCARKWLIL